MPFPLPDKTTSTGYSTVQHKTCHNSTTVPAFITKSFTHMADSPVSWQAKNLTKCRPFKPRAPLFSGPTHTKTYNRFNSVKTNDLSTSFGIQAAQTIMSRESKFLKDQRMFRGRASPFFIVTSLDGHTTQLDIKRSVTLQTRYTSTTGHAKLV